MQQKMELNVESEGNLPEIAALEKIIRNLTSIYRILEENEPIAHVSMEVLLAALYLKTDLIKRSPKAVPKHGFVKKYVLDVLKVLTDVRIEVLSNNRVESCNKLSSTEMKIIHRWLKLSFCPENTVYMIWAYSSESYKSNNIDESFKRNLLKHVKILSVRVASVLLGMAEQVYTDSDLRAHYSGSRPTRYFLFKKEDSFIRLPSINLPSTGYSFIVNVKLIKNENSTTRERNLLLLRTNDGQSTCGIEYSLVSSACRGSYSIDSSSGRTRARTPSVDIEDEKEAIRLIIRCKGSKNNSWKTCCIDLSDYIKWGKFHNLVVVHKKIEPNMLGYLRKVGVNLGHDDNVASYAKVFVDGQVVTNITNYSPGRSRSVTSFPIRYPWLSCPLNYNCLGYKSFAPGSLSTFYFFKSCFSEAQVKRIFKVNRRSGRFDQLPITLWAKGSGAVSDELPVLWKKSHAEFSFDTISHLDHRLVRLKFAEWMLRDIYKKNPDLSSSELHKIPQVSALENIVEELKLVQENYYFTLENGIFTGYKELLDNISLIENETNPSELMFSCSPDVEHLLKMPPALNFGRLVNVLYEADDNEINTDQESRGTLQYVLGSIAKPACNITPKIKHEPISLVDVEVIDLNKGKTLDITGTFNISWILPLFQLYIPDSIAFELCLQPKLPDMDVLRHASVFGNTYLLEGNLHKSLVSGMATSENFSSVLLFLRNVCFPKATKAENIMLLDMLLSTGFFPKFGRILREVDPEFFSPESVVPIFSIVESLCPLLSISEDSDADIAFACFVSFCREVIFSPEIWVKQTKTVQEDWATRLLEFCARRPLLIRIAIGARRIVDSFLHFGSKESSFSQDIAPKLVSALKHILLNSKPSQLVSNRAFDSHYNQTSGSKTSKLMKEHLHSSIKVTEYEILFIIGFIATNSSNPVNYYLVKMLNSFLRPTIRKKAVRECSKVGGIYKVSVSPSHLSIENVDDATNDLHEISLGFSNSIASLLTKLGGVDLMLGLGSRHQELRVGKEYSSEKPSSSMFGLVCPDGERVSTQVRTEMIKMLFNLMKLASFPKQFTEAKSSFERVGEISLNFEGSFVVHQKFGTKSTNLLHNSDEVSSVRPKGSDISLLEKQFGILLRSLLVVSFSRFNKLRRNAVLNEIGSSKVSVSSLKIANRLLSEDIVTEEILQACLAGLLGIPVELFPIHRSPFKCISITELVEVTSANVGFLVANQQRKLDDIFAPFVELGLISNDDVMVETLPLVSRLLYVACCESSDKSRNTIAWDSVYSSCLLVLLNCIEQNKKLLDLILSVPRWYDLLFTLLVPPSQLCLNDIDYPKKSYDLLVTFLGQQILSIIEFEYFVRNSQRMQCVQHLTDRIHGKCATLIKENQIVKFKVSVRKANTDVTLSASQQEKLVELNTRLVTSKIVRGNVLSLHERIKGSKLADIEGSLDLFSLMFSNIADDAIYPLTLFDVKQCSYTAIASSSLITTTSNKLKQRAADPQILFDSNPETKWVDTCSWDKTDSFRSWVEFKSSSQTSCLSTNVEAVVNCALAYGDKKLVQTVKHTESTGQSSRIVRYMITSAGDSTFSDPYGWRLFGVNSEQPPQLLDSREKIVFDSRGQSVSFWLKETGFYESYRIEFSCPEQRMASAIWKNLSQKQKASIQICEIKLYECNSRFWPADPVTAVLCNKQQNEHTEFVHCIDFLLQVSRLSAFSSRSFFVSWRIFCTILMMDILAIGKLFQVVELLKYILTTAFQFQPDIHDSLWISTMWFIYSVQCSWDEKTKNLMVSVIQDALKENLHCFQAASREIVELTIEKMRDDERENLKTEQIEVLVILQQKSWIAVIGMFDLLTDLSANVEMVESITEPANETLAVAYGVSGIRKPACLPRVVKAQLHEISQRELDRRFHNFLMKDRVAALVLEQVKELFISEEADYYTRSFGHKNKMLRGITFWRVLEDFPQFSFTRVNLWKSSSLQIDPGLGKRNLLKRNPSGNPYFACSFGLPVEEAAPSLIQGDWLSFFETRHPIYISDPNVELKQEDGIDVEHDDDILEDSKISPRNTFRLTERSDFETLKDDDQVDNFDTDAEYFNSGNESVAQIVESPSFLFRDVEHDSVLSKKPPLLTLKRRLILSDWVNRPPSLIRGERAGPWPAVGKLTTKLNIVENASMAAPDATSICFEPSVLVEEEVIFGVRCNRVFREKTVTGRLIVTSKAMYFDPDPPAHLLKFYLKEKSCDLLLAEKEDEYNVHASGDNKPIQTNNTQDTVQTKNMYEEQLREYHKARDKRVDGKRLLRKRMLLKSIKRILYRRYEMRDAAMEVFFSPSRSRQDPSLFGSSSWLLYFPDVSQKRRRLSSRDKVMEALWSNLPKDAKMVSHSPKQFLPSLPRTAQNLELLEPVCHAWRERAISNFEYLMHLNLIAGRSELDLSQYPVFPWIISNYSSENLDLTDKSNYRDLSKPMGAINPERLQDFEEKYNCFDDCSIPKFFYGSHYSTMAGVVLYFLMRSEPFASLHVKLQDGHFDYADRLFNSVETTFRMCTTSMSEVKELIPEFYCNPDFLRNHNCYNLGNKQDGRVSNHVQLPKYISDNSAEEFIGLMRQALESDIVSDMLNHWVDLIFGFKQKGPAAVDAKNVFYYMTYPGAINIDDIDEDMRNATLTQVANFGQCPIQIFLNPSPRRGRLQVEYPLPLYGKNCFEEIIQLPPSGEEIVSHNHQGNIIAKLGQVVGCVDVMFIDSSNHSNNLTLTSTVRASYDAIGAVAVGSNHLAVGTLAGQLKIFHVSTKGYLAIRPHWVFNGHILPIDSCMLWEEYACVVSKSASLILIHCLETGRLLDAKDIKDENEAFSVGIHRASRVIKLI